MGSISSMTYTVRKVTIRGGTVIGREDATSSSTDYSAWCDFYIVNGHGDNPNRVDADERFLTYLRLNPSIDNNNVLTIHFNGMSSVRYYTASTNGDSTTQPFQHIVSYATDTSGNYTEFYNTGVINPGSNPVDSGTVGVGAWGNGYDLTISPQQTYTFPGDGVLIGHIREVVPQDDDVYLYLLQIHNDNIVPVPARSTVYVDGKMQKVYVAGKQVNMFVNGQGSWDPGHN